MNRQSLARRRFLQGALASLAVSAAGCLELDGSDTPGYTDWVPAGDESHLVGYVDLDLVEEEDDGSGIPLFYPSPSDDSGEPKRVQPADGELDDPTDPLLAVPMETGGLFIAGAAIALGFPGLGYLVDPQQESGASELLFVDGVGLVLGDIDVEEADQKLRTSGAGQFAVPYESAGELDGFSIYEPTEAESDTQIGVVALSESAVLVAESRTEIETVVETAEGDHGRAVDENTEFGWLVDAVGDGDLIAGWIGPVAPEDLRFEQSDAETVHDVFLGEDRVLSAVTLAPDDNEVTADLAAYPDGLTERERALESTLGTEAADRSLSFEDERLTATGTYEDVSFERVDPEGDDDGIEQEEVPEKVAEAVPEDAFTFEYDEEEEAVKVEIVEDFQAETVKVESVNSGYEASIDRASSGTWLNAYVDPEGDTVRVIVTVDGTSGVVATEEVP